MARKKMRSSGEDRIFAAFCRAGLESAANAATIDRLVFYEKRTFCVDLTNQASSLIGGVITPPYECIFIGTQAVCLP